MFRFSGDTSGGLTDFYQKHYAEPGLTTELPSEGDLQRLIESAFKGSGKDFSWIIPILKAAGVQAGERILDYGANWGYCTWQFRRAGFDAEGFEVSRTRAKFGLQLGVNLHTDLQQVRGPFDVVYSCHVLEHVDNPLAVIRRQLSLVRPGGLVIAHTPNGSADHRRANQVGFHRIWGQAHPFLLSEEFVLTNFRASPLFVSSVDDPAIIKKWDCTSQYVGDMSGAGLFFIIRNGRAASGDP